MAIRTVFTKINKTNNSVDSKINERKKIKMPFPAAFTMVSGYISRKIADQVKAVAFIVIYLLIFQILVVGSLDAFSFKTFAGIIMVVLGLSFFMEGLELGLMPLGESVGLKLPVKRRLYQMLLFGLLVGFISTLAEPAIGTLRSVGRGIEPWGNPLLFTLLDLHPEALITAVGSGVALAVALSLFRYHKGISLKPFVLIIVPVLMILTIVFSANPMLREVIGLAWDTGAVTTGPVTVPLVLALGIGVSRASGDRNGSTGGFGSIALASLFPVLGVMVLSLGIFITSPGIMSETEFFAPENREQAATMFGSERAVETYAFESGSEKGRRSFYETENDYQSALLRLMDGDKDDVLSIFSPEMWLSLSASDTEREFLGFESPTTEVRAVQVSALEVIKEESRMSLRAILPLAAILLAVLLLILKEHPRYTDEFFLGIGITVIGMILLTSGIRFGLVPLGDTVGQQLPKVYEAQQKEEFINIASFDLSLLRNAIDEDGRQIQFFAFMDNSGKIKEEPFYPAQYHQNTGVYTHIRRTPILFNSKMTTVGMVFVLLFAFGLGYGSTLAEPALNALGNNIERITVGTVPKKGVIRAVSIGVGLGLITGIIRIMYDIPTAWLLVPAYAVLIPLTIFSDKEFTGIAWDSGGVTTGPITVPLVLSLGLGIGGALGMADGFGILALASVFPILSVQTYGLMLSVRRKRTMVIIEKEAADENQ